MPGKSRSSDERQTLLEGGKERPSGFFSTIYCQITVFVALASGITAGLAVGGEDQAAFRLGFHNGTTQAERDFSGGDYRNLVDKKIEFQNVGITAGVFGTALGSLSFAFAYLAIASQMSFLKRVGFLSASTGLAFLDVFGLMGMAPESNEQAGQWLGYEAQWCHLRANDPNQDYTCEAYPKNVSSYNQSPGVSVPSIVISWTSFFPMAAGILTGLYSRCCRSTAASHDDVERPRPRSRV